jgi:membrane protein
MFRRIVQFFYELIKAIFQDNISIMASAIAFFGFSAMIPLVLLIVYCTSIFIPHAQIEHLLNDVLKSYVPTIPDSKLYLKQSVTRLTILGPKVGLFGLLGLLWTAVGGFVSLQYILDVVWGITHRRSFVKQFIVGFGMLGILIVLTFLASIATTVTPTIIERVTGITNDLVWLQMVHAISHVLFPLLLFITCYFCYRFLPSNPINHTYLLIGACISTLAIYLSRGIFVWSTSHIGRYQLIYGSLSFIMLLITWIYVVSVIVLFGAEVAVTLHQMNPSEKKNNTEK